MLPYNSIQAIGTSSGCSIVYRAVYRELNTLHASAFKASNIIAIASYVI